MNRTALLPLFLLIAATSACMQSIDGEGVSASPAASHTEEHVGFAASALETGDYEADGDTQPDGVDLWNTDAGLCVLTGITGKMAAEGEGDFVIAGSRGQLVADRGKWRLEPGWGMRMTARCTPWTDFAGVGPLHRYSGPSGWQEPSASTTSMWDANALCFLSGYGGDTDGASSAFVTRGAKDWSLVVGGGWGGGHPHVGSGMCVATGRSAPWMIVSNHFWAQEQPDVWMIKETDGICMLTGVGGQFRGWGESVTVAKEDGWYKLRGTSLQSGVHAYAQCVSWAQAAPAPVPVRRPTDIPGLRRAGGAALAR